MIRGWRGAFAGVFQLVFLLPCLWLVMILADAVPGSAAAANPVLVGHWESAPANDWSNEPELEMRLGDEGRLALEFLVSPEDFARVQARGHYRIKGDKLVIRVGRERLVWQIAWEGRDLMVTTREGKSVRLRRSV